MNASNKVFLSIDSSNEIEGIDNVVFISYSFPINSCEPNLLYGLNVSVTLSLPFQFGNLFAKSLKFILNLPFGDKFLNKLTFVLFFCNNSTSIEDTANEFHSTSYSNCKSENEGTSIELGAVI